MEHQLNDELTKKIKAFHDEEVADHKKYIEMAELLTEHGHHDIAGIFKDIAHDEETHITLMKFILNEH